MLHFLLMELVGAAIEDGINREWLVVRMVRAAHETCTYGTDNSPGINEKAAEILYNEITRLDI